MANYVVHYADGTRAEIPIRDKEEIMNWWYPAHGAKYRAAIHVPNAQTDDVGLVAFAWDNPHPEKVVRSIEFQSLNADGIVVVAAVTVSDRPATCLTPKTSPRRTTCRATWTRSIAASGFPSKSSRTASSRRPSTSPLR